MRVRANYRSSSSIRNPFEQVVEIEITLQKFDKESGMRIFSNWVVALLREVRPEKWMVQAGGGVFSFCFVCAELSYLLMAPSRKIAQPADPQDVQRFASGSNDA